jgi:hypothetical protein
MEEYLVQTATASLPTGITVLFTYGHKLMKRSGNHKLLFLAILGLLLILAGIQHTNILLASGDGHIFFYINGNSEDQTTRLFSKWVQDSLKPATWHEISRPQIHGYDMTCVTFVTNTPNRIISGAEEKVLRVFDCPQTTVVSLRNVSKIDLPEANVRVILSCNDRL